MPKRPTIYELYSMRPRAKTAKPKRVRPTLKTERLLRSIMHDQSADADRWYALAMGMAERKAALGEVCDYWNEQGLKLSVQLRETRQLLAEAVERTSHEPVVEWYRAAKRALRGDE